MKNRLFIALKLPRDIIDEIDSIRNSIYQDDIDRKWESKEKFHLTLKFLGDVEESDSVPFIKKIKPILEGYNKITCEFDKFGFFLSRILWISLKVDDKLLEIVDKVENEFEHLGFEKEKRMFKPHITLLRIKENPDDEFISSFKNFILPQKSFYCNEISLMKSKLLPGGSVYSDVKLFKLL
ncbi:MAG: RNA 2',3'-cyclic phosphodiesterase [Ignavibacteriales bacterium]|nr:RNA 2',3'-cyclic phosphodiesterase [Ignavibacteriales bacterium]